MISMSLKRDKLDCLTSDIVRYRDNWFCQKCGKSFLPPHAGYHCSHFKSRAHKGTRYDFKNCDGLCWNCHKYFAAHIDEYRDWKVNRIGQSNVELLEYKARHPFKLSRGERHIMIMLYSDILVKEKVRFNAGGR